MAQRSTRSRFSNAAKISILANGDRRGLSNLQIARETGCAESTIRYWKKHAESINQANARNHSRHPGRPRANTDLERRVISEIDKLIFYGIPINQKDIIRLATSIQPGFKEGNQVRLTTWASTFLAKEKIVLRRVTQYGRRLPENVEEIKNKFLQDFWRLFIEHGYSEDLIINIDQTGVFFENPRNITLAHRGASQVPIISNKLSVRATAVLAMTMSGQKLRPYVIFKGKPGPRSRISRSFMSLPSDIDFSVQQNAWVDRPEMIKYIDIVLRPYMQARSGRRGLLLLDSFSVHLSEPVKCELMALNFDLLYIPKGMTGYLQPLDISVNKPFKDMLKSDYTQWLISQAHAALLSSRRPKPTRNLIASWISRAWSLISDETMRNAFSIFRSYEESSLDTLAFVAENINAIAR